MLGAARSTFCSSCRCCLAACAAVVALAAGASADGIDLPVATQGLAQWVGVVARAVSVGARDKAASLEALNSFQSTAMAKLAKHVSACPPMCTLCNTLCPGGAIVQDLQSSCLRLHDHHEQLSQSFFRHVTMNSLQLMLAVRKLSPQRMSFLRCGS